MSSTIFSSKKPQEWSETIREKCLPLLHQASSSSLLKEATDGLVQEIISHFNTLEDSTIEDLLSASECKSMDTTFLLIGFGFGCARWMKILSRLVSRNGCISPMRRNVVSIYLHSEAERRSSMVESSKVLK
ncbi:unnamed protein product [Brassica oleracea]